MRAVKSLQECVNLCSKNVKSSGGRKCTHFEYGWRESDGTCSLRSSDTTTNDLVVATNPTINLTDKWSCVVMKSRLESETRLINRIPAANSVQHWDIDIQSWDAYWTVGCSFQADQSAKITTILVVKMEVCMSICGSYSTYSCTHFYVSKSGNVFNCDLLRIPSGTNNINFDKSKTTQPCVSE